MHLIILFFATFASSFGASLLPGLLNMNAAKISAEKGKRNAVFFSFGVCVIVGIQALIAVFISKFLSKNPQVVNVLMKIALGIFAICAVYFFFHAKKGIKNKKQIKYVEVSRRNSFFKGMFMGALNLMLLPFYCGLNTAWRVSGWIKFQWEDTVLFVVGAMLGTFSILYVYIFYFHKLENKSNKFSQYSDYIMSGLMLGLTILTFVKILYQ
ncbi:Threonine/homoserine/homoserine lactone efflux protein [Pustulibacterium marinum]|uniref:Threonine/homoserine/homoserine lactone efflux protein n=1 Tax=Pustulibacterium marinum TaxID=1224947 RepID=A0A1I7EYD2_9FLAO|nr:LysE family transporter [Pustulibacterium marinum]SFU28948.1 Threonine/homoserine/homoserine lactone efflux protein [Pustulibacterium marinum]